MRRLSHLRFLLSITHSNLILRRYFVVNGFDGVLTMMGLIIGFIVSTPADLAVIINVCLGAAIALGMSGVSSAYVSESAERRHDLGKLEDAMISDLQQSTHGQAARLTPLLVALVNGLAPLVFSLLILVPLWLASYGVPLPISPLYGAILVAFVLLFLLGVFLGRITNISWLRSGLQTLVVAVVTAALIYLLTGS